MKRGETPHQPLLAVNGCAGPAGGGTLFPLVWMVSASFMAPGEASHFPPPLLPAEPTLHNYRELFAARASAARPPTACWWRCWPRCCRWPST
jgi:hypothetical protein